MIVSATTRMFSIFRMSELDSNISEIKKKCLEVSKGGRPYWEFFSYASTRNFLGSNAKILIIKFQRTRPNSALGS